MADMDESMKNDEEAEICPGCKTSKELMRTLTLLYSTCCGRVLCTTCIDGKFKKKKKEHKYTCSFCGAKISRKDFSDKNLELQQYNKEKEIRNKIARVYNQRRDDFKDDDEYNDYLEMVQDIVYDLLHGTKPEQQEAKRKMEEYKKTNKSTIENNFRRELAQAESGTLGVGVASAIPIPPPMTNIPPMQIMPVQGAQPRETKRDQQRQEEEERLRQLPKEERDRQMAYQRQIRKEIAKGPGGYSIEFHNTRMLQEAFSSMFLDL